MTDTTPNTPCIGKLTKQRFDGYLPIVIDVETSGVDPLLHALIEIAAIPVHCNEDNLLVPAESHFSTHVTPFEGAQFDPKAMAINRIDIDHPFRLAIAEEIMIQKLDLFVRQALSTYHCRRAVLVGHNAHFDLSFLNASRRRSKIETNPFHAFTCFDTATLSGAVIGKTVLAKALIETQLGYDKEAAHSALYDTQQTAALFCHLCNHIPVYEKKK